MSRKASGKLEKLQNAEMEVTRLAENLVEIGSNPCANALTRAIIRGLNDVVDLIKLYQTQIEAELQESGGVVLTEA